MADAKNSGGIFFTDPSTKEKETDFDFTGTAILAGYKLVADASASSKLYIGGYKKVQSSCLSILLNQLRMELPQLNLQVLSKSNPTGDKNEI